MLIKCQRGLSLIELLIGILIGTIVVAGGIKLFTGSVKDNRDHIRLNMLNQDLRIMMDVMVREIRRAGFTANPMVNNEAAFLNTLRHNPFAPINIENIATKTNACITFMYNKDLLNPDTVAEAERFGFKLATDTTFSPTKNVIRMRRTGTALACGNGTWESITSPDVEITDLSFDLKETALNVSERKKPSHSIITGCNVGDECLYIRTINISLTGKLISLAGNKVLDKDHQLTQTLNETVRVRNDHYCHIVSLTPSRDCN